MPKRYIFCNCPNKRTFLLYKAKKVCYKLFYPNEKSGCKASAKDDLINAGWLKNGIKGLNTLSIATNNLPKRNPKETLPSFGFQRFGGHHMTQWKGMDSDFNKNILDRIHPVK